MKEIKGVIVPILTPMREDGTINSEELVNQIERLIDAGIHGIFVLGTNGEGYILDEDEKTEVIRVAVNTVNGRVPVYAGTGCVSTRDTVRMSRKAKELGADVLSIITPSFAAASQEELIRHYETVANTVDMPILLYNIPARTGNALTPATVQKLSQVPNIIGVKDSSGNFDNILQYAIHRENAWRGEAIHCAVRQRFSDFVDIVGGRQGSYRCLRQCVPAYDGKHLRKIRCRGYRGCAQSAGQHPAFP